MYKIIIVCLLTANICGGTTIYQIGNSLTWDSQPNRSGEQADLNNLEITSGYHIRSNSTLQTIWSLPNSTNVTPTDFGRFSEALPSYEWDAITLQLYQSSENNSMQSDLDTVLQYRALAKSASNNTTTKFYIYESWRNRSDQNAWDTQQVSTTTHSSRIYYDRIVDELNNLYPGEFYLVPTGQVINNLYNEWVSDEIHPAITSFNGQIYRDSIHLSNELGRFIANTTVLSTILSVNPTEFETDWDIEPSLRSYLQDLVWETVTSNSRTGVIGFDRADFNQDGLIDYEDYTTWDANYGSDTALYVDFNNDGTVNAADYTGWRDSLSSPSYTIPEPDAFLILAAIIFIIGFYIK